MTGTNDPLLQPFRLKHLVLRNRIMSTSHEPAYSEDGMPKDRYRAYHVEKARGGLALTMTAGTAVVSPDSPPAFGNLFAYKDEIVPWIRRMTDEIHEHGAAAMIQISHLGRRTGWGQDDWLPVIAPSRHGGSIGQRRGGHRTMRQSVRSFGGSEPRRYDALRLAICRAMRKTVDATSSRLNVRSLMVSRTVSRTSSMRIAWKKPGSR